MKKEYIAPEVRNMTRFAGDRSYNELQLGGYSVGTDVMHTNSSFFEEDDLQEGWTYSSNLWDVE